MKDHILTSLFTILEPHKPWIANFMLFIQKRRATDLKALKL